MENERLSNEQVLLKTSMFGGFEKREVLAYIDRLREDNQNGKNELENQLDQMSQARENLEQQIGGFQKTMSALEQQLTQKSGRINDLTTELGGLKSLLEEKEKVLSKTELALDVQKEQNRLLSLKAQTLEQKSKKYDEMSAEVGEVLIAAKQSAKEIVQAATTEADEIRHDAADAARQASQKLDVLRQDVAMMRKNIEGFVANFGTRLDEINGVIERVSERAASLDFEDVQVEQRAAVAVGAPEEAPKPPCPHSFFRAAAQTER